MTVDSKELEGKGARGIFRYFIEHVTKTDEELHEKETRGGKSTDLKIYIIDSSDNILGRIEEISEDLAMSNSVGKYAKKFFENHIISEEKLSSDAYLIEFYTPRYERRDEFVVVDRGDFLWALTVERKEWAEDTIEKLIKYTPQMERVFLSSNDLEGVMRSVVDSDVSGFTAKYHSPYRDRDATLRFHGAEPDDMEKAEKHFQATPTRIEFNQKNSPDTAIQGSGSSDGILTAESVRSGSEPKAVNTFLNISGDFSLVDSERYDVNTDSKLEFFDNSFSIDGFTSIELYNPDRTEAENLGSELEDQILSKNAYRYGKWGHNTYFVYDKHHEEIFELGIESPELVLHSRESTTSLSLREFCRNVIDEFDSTYSIRKKETKVSAQ